VTAAISFPVFILILIPIRKFLLPKCFGKRYLKQLDGNEDEGEIKDRKPSDDTTDGAEQELEQSKSKTIAVDV